VTGAAEEHIPAERGVLRLAVSVESPDRASALDEAGRVAAGLRAEAEDLVASGAAVGVRADDLWVQTRHRYPSTGDPVTVHVAAAPMSVEFSDFAALSEWASRVGSRSGVEVHGVEWRLTGSTRRDAEERVRRAAVADAGHRAATYASAAGLPAPRLVRLAEPASIGGPQPMMRAMASDAVAIDVGPGEVAVGAVVRATFTAGAGEPGAEGGARIQTA